MKSFLRQSVLLFSIVLIIFSCTRNYTDEEIDKMFKPITSMYGIKIIYEINDNFSPMLYTGKRAKLDQLESMDHRVLVHYPRILSQSLKKYPVQVIRKYLDAIYLAKRIDRDGVSYSGTYGYFFWSVYLVDDGWKNEDRSERTFHHEFSSLLLKRHSFLLNPWLKQNPKNFNYLYYDNTNKLDIRIRGKGRKSDYENGFMTDYGRTSFENDFNEYAAMIFTHPQKFKKIMHQYPRVRGKFLLFLDFYHKIDPIFTEEYLLSEKKVALSGSEPN